MIEKWLENWHKQVRGEFAGGLDALLADDVVFYSPIVFSPQKGIELTKMYLQAAGATFEAATRAQGESAAKPESKFHYIKEVFSGNCAILEFETEMGGSKEKGAAAKNPESKFHYTKEVLSGNCAVLEFETEMGGKYINGVDIITWNDEGRIIEFKVMIRPLQAVNLMHQQMAAMLEKMNG